MTTAYPYTWSHRHRSIVTTSWVCYPPLRVCQTARSNTNPWGSRMASDLLVHRDSSCWNLTVHPTTIGERTVERFMAELSNINSTIRSASMDVFLGGYPKNGLFLTINGSTGWWRAPHHGGYHCSPAVAPGEHEELLRSLEGAGAADDRWEVLENLGESDYWVIINHWQLVVSYG